MQYSGFLVQYVLNSNNEVKFAGPKNTIEEITKVYNDLALLEPAISQRRIVRIVSGANPAWV